MAAAGIFIFHSSVLSVLFRDRCLLLRKIVKCTNEVKRKRRLQQVDVRLCDVKFRIDAIMEVEGDADTAVTAVNEMFPPPPTKPTRFRSAYNFFYSAKCSSRKEDPSLATLSISSLSKAYGKEWNAMAGDQRPYLVMQEEDKKRWNAAMAGWNEIQNWMKPKIPLPPHVLFTRSFHGKGKFVAGFEEWNGLMEEEKGSFKTLFEQNQKRYNKEMADWKRDIEKEEEGVRRRGRQV